MANEAIIEAEYVEWKMVKTRKALQLIFELPLEHQALVQRALGTPMPDTSTPVAIVRLISAEQHSNVEPIEDHRPAKMAQLAGILCNEKAFWTFLVERGHATENKEQAAEHVRLICGAIPSRADLDSNSQAGQKFKDLRADYQLWLRDAA